MNQYVKKKCVWISLLLSWVVIFVGIRLFVQHTENEISGIYTSKDSDSTIAIEIDLGKHYFFIYDRKSSSANNGISGIVKLEGSTLVLQADDKECSYFFWIEDEELIFDLQNSNISLKTMNTESFDATFRDKEVFVNISK